MTRASKRGWFVASFGVAVFVLAGAACSKATDPGTSDADSGSPTLGGDATSNDGGPGFELDALPTSFPDSTVPDDASDDAPANATPDTGAQCVKPSASDPCGLDPQCGCPSLETCDFDPAGTATLCTTAGNALAGHGCASTASCAPGLTCFNGACRPYCSNTGDAGCNAKLPEGGACVAITGADGGPIPSYDVCTFHCQLQDPNACGATGDLNGGCTFDGVSGTDCIGVGLTELGDNCTYLNDCKPGLVCVGQCLPWCRVGHAPSDCGDGEACQAFAAPVPAPYGVEYGYCP